jgi:Phosphoenolpyruvate phosphomutase
MRTQVEKGRLFRELHQRPGILILPNPWDAGTAKLLASVGFEALATTSLGMSNALGRVAGRALSAVPSFWRTAASSPRQPTCRSTPTLKTATPMIPRKPRPSYATPRRWV